VIHSEAHAVAALRASVEREHPVTLLSAPDAGIYAGPGWWREMVAAARTAVPTAECIVILDCGGDAGAVLAAIRAGVAAIVFTGRADVAARLADIAAQRGSRLLTARPQAALDLGVEFFAASERLRRLCADALASTDAFC
jgi:hypothetical protein